MAASGEDFTLADFLGTFGPVVRPRQDHPVVVHGDELARLPADQVSNPTELSIAGRLPDHDVRDLPPGDPARPELGHAAALPRDRPCGAGRTRIQRDRGRHGHLGVRDFVYTPPWAWHRHYNDSTTEPVEFLTIESSRLLALFGLVRRQSAGQVSVDEARGRFAERDDHGR